MGKKINPNNLEWDDRWNDELYYQLLHRNDKSPHGNQKQGKEDDSELKKKRKQRLQELYERSGQSRSDRKEIIKMMEGIGSVHQFVKFMNRFIYEIHTIFIFENLGYEAKVIFDRLEQVMNDLDHGETYMIDYTRLSDRIAAREEMNSYE